MIPLKIRVREQETETGYGVTWQQQDLDHFKELAKATNFEVTGEWSKSEVFFLELLKEYQSG